MGSKKKNHKGNEYPDSQSQINIKDWILKKKYLIASAITIGAIAISTPVYPTNNHDLKSNQEIHSEQITSQVNNQDYNPDALSKK
jgi:hypothetical protein